MPDRTDYPAGVPCWVDLIQPDFDRTTAFYTELFGWTYEVRTPPSSPFRYAYALLDGKTVAGIGGPPQGNLPSPGWTHYVRVDSAEATVAAVDAAGGTVLSPPVDIPGSGRTAACADPGGAVFGVWEPAALRGAQAVNVSGSWNFSELHTAAPDAARAFYSAVFGWECDEIDLGDGQSAWLWRMPGYGEHLAANDPEMKERLASVDAPTGFGDAVAWLEPFSPADTATNPAERWTITFAVADADAACARAVHAGAAVIRPLHDAPFVRASVVRDPQGAELTLSEYRPPEPG